MNRLFQRLWIGIGLACATLVSPLFGQESPPVQESTPPVQESTPPVQESKGGETTNSPEPTPPALDPSKTKHSVDVSVPEDVRLAMEELNNALQSGSSRRIGRKFSVAAMFDVLVERQLVSGSEAELAEFRKLLETGLRSQFRTFSDLAWVEAKWVRFEQLDEQRVVLLARHYDSIEPTHTVRWWLKREEESWQIYDFEIVDFNLRVSTMLGTGFSFAKDRPALLAAIQELSIKVNSLASGQLDEEDMEQLIEVADEVLDDEYPEDIKRFGLLIRAMALMQLDELPEALDDLKQLEKMPVESPILYGLRGDILSAQERFEAAIESYKKLGDSLGYDVSVHESIADAYLALGEWEKAEQQARLGLQDWPESTGCLASLAAALPPNKVAELDPFLRELDYDEEALATVIFWCIEADRLAGARFAYKLLKEHHQDSDLIEEFREALDTSDYRG
ncbi:MAG: hypothetical protein JNL67_12690 [Planctomycetaceae bacterium]|nr:hypothetical protein [Planctomycetaceae bacterium]